jgi:3-hydroxyisobutyrate dehydrogenase-like beta-hydroxyacid dehydrogenase
MHPKSEGGNEMKQIGFIGLGTMGAPMASNLLRSGFQVTVYNRTAEKCRPLVQEGAQVGRYSAGGC